MSDNVKLGGSLPEQDVANGLDALAGRIVRVPDDRIVAVVVLGTKKLTTDIETGDVVPTMRVLRVEPIVEPEDKVRLGQLANRAFERRTGKTVLPLELEDELGDAFGTGEE